MSVSVDWRGSYSENSACSTRGGDVGGEDDDPRLPSVNGAARTFTLNVSVKDKTVHTKLTY